jgi:hypothetical protein
MMLMVRRDEVSAIVADGSMNENPGAVPRHDGHRIRIDTDAVELRGHIRISLAPKISCVVRWDLEASAATLIDHATIDRERRAQRATAHRRHGCNARQLRQQRCELVPERAIAKAG